MGARPGEYTKTSIETEVTIPWKTYLLIGVIGNLSILLLIVMAWCLWLTIALNNGAGFGSWAGRRWWPWLSHWWPMILFVLAGWWAIIASVPTLYRFIVEQVFKSLPPTYQAADLEQGAWPFRKKTSRYDEFYSNK